MSSAFWRLAVLVLLGFKMEEGSGVEDSSSMLSHPLIARSPPAAEASPEAELAAATRSRSTAAGRGGGEGGASGMTATPGTCPAAAWMTSACAGEVASDGAASTGVPGDKQPSRPRLGKQMMTYWQASGHVQVTLSPAFKSTPSPRETVVFGLPERTSSMRPAVTRTYSSNSGCWKAWPQRSVAEATHAERRVSPEDSVPKYSRMFSAGVSTMLTALTTSVAMAPVADGACRCAPRERRASARRRK
mmetsp:Transcript_63502/g.160183  ORF Transcript_63502/g.160183 Transcript_63502/m.160183 type:complete len:246 (-) Transcript_63502:12-749(-)